LRHQPVDIVIERLFVQGELNTLTERYGEHDNFYFQMFCDAWNTDEDYFWFERICIGRLMLMLPHPAHAVFLLQAPDPLVLWSENARTAAKHCGLIQQLLISAMKKERLFTAKPHSLKSETKQNGLAQWLDVFAQWLDASMA